MFLSITETLLFTKALTQTGESEDKRHFLDSGKAQIRSISKFPWISIRLLFANQFSQSPGSGYSISKHAQDLGTGSDNKVSGSSIVSAGCSTV